MLQKSGHEEPDKRADWARVLRAARYSLEGLAAAFKHEQAFRQETFIALFMGAIALWLPVGLTGRALLLGSLLLVLIVELLNSSIEWVVDYVSLERHPFAKRAKDMASGAVFLSLVNAGLVWGLVLAEHWGAVRAALRL